MKKTFTLIQLLLVLGSTITYAQTQLKHEPKAYRDSVGRLYWNISLQGYLKIFETPQDTGHTLYSENQNKYSNPFYFDTDGVNYIRTKFAVDPESRKAINPPTEILWEIYVDGHNPTTKVSFLDAPKYTGHKQVYYGKGLNLDLSAKDGGSGVEATYCSIDSVPYKPYTQVIPFNTEGFHNIKAYSSDNVGNAERPINNDFIVDLTVPKSVYNITGIVLKNILSPNSIVYLTVSDSLSGVAKTYYKIDDGKEMVYDGKTIPIAHLDDGDHVLSFYSVDHVENKETPVIFKFYLDKLAPILASDILGDRFIVKDQIYFSGRTKLKLTAVDNKSGIKDIMFSIDGEDFKSYDQPFYLPSFPGVHVVRYFAIDQMENQTSGKKTSNGKYEEYKHSVSKIYVDLTGPTLSFDYIGEHFRARDTMFVSGKTKIQLAATDSESGFQYLSYSLDDTKEEQRYTEPFTIEKSGLHTVEFFGYDNVNNRNKESFHFIVDNDAPEINYNFSIKSIGTKEGLPVYPAYVILYLSATDVKVGTDNIFYEKNGTPEVRFSRYMQGFKAGELNVIKVKAYDKLKNISEKEIKFYVE